MNKKLLTLLLIPSMLLIVTGCMTPQLDAPQTQAGAATGAITGAILGANTKGHNKGKRTAVGATVGAVVGGLAGNVMAGEKQKQTGGWE